MTVHSQAGAWERTREEGRPCPGQDEILSYESPRPNLGELPVLLI